MPLRLDELGAGALAIGAAFLVAALGEAVDEPARGARRRPARAFGRSCAARRSSRLRASRCWPCRSSAVLVAALLVATAVALGALWTPSGSLVSLRAEQLGVDQGWAFALNNLGWSAGVAIGAAAGGALGQLVGDGLAYGICAVLLVATGALAGARYGGPASRRPERSGAGATVRAVIAAELELDLEVFSGPFDLLLTLVLREDVDLLEVELADVVVSYLDHLDLRGELDLEVATEFLVLIAALLELKSRLMLRGRGRRGARGPRAGRGGRGADRADDRGAPLPARRRAPRRAARRRARPSLPQRAAAAVPAARRHGRARGGLRARAARGGDRRRCCASRRR